MGFSCGLYLADENEARTYDKAAEKLGLSKIDKSYPEYSGKPEVWCGYSAYRELFDQLTQLGDPFEVESDGVKYTDYIIPISLFDGMDRAARRIENIEGVYDTMIIWKVDELAGERAWFELMSGQVSTETYSCCIPFATGVSISLPEFRVEHDWRDALWRPAYGDADAQQTQPVTDRILAHGYKSSVDAKIDHRDDEFSVTKTVCDTRKSRKFVGRLIGTLFDELDEPMAHAIYSVFEDSPFIAISSMREFAQIRDICEKAGIETLTLSGGW